MSLPQPPDLSPGWYGDPTGAKRQRWWNGSTWTEDHRDFPKPPPVSEQAATKEAAIPGVASTSKPSFRGMDLPKRTAASGASSSGAGSWKVAWGCAGLLGVVALLFVGCTMVLASNGGGGDDSYRGCSKLLPSEDFKKCINREGVWSGAD